MTWEGSRLLARETSSPPVELIPLSQAQFAHVFSDGGAVIHQYTLTFLTDDSGQVTGVEVTDGSGGATVARKIVAPASGSGWVCAATVLALLAVAASWYGWRIRTRNAIVVRTTIGDVTPMLTREGRKQC